MKRNIFIDMCKLFAMFMVTWEHIAQYLTGRTFTDFLGGHGYGIAFCMPLFMICSGYFLKPENIRSRVTNYIWNKFERLMLPCMSWYLIYSIASGSFVAHHIITFYWFLSCLFVCLSIVAIALKFCKSEIAAILISTIVVVLFPHSDILKINFMLPFIWGGYLLRFVIDKMGERIKVLFVLLVLSAYLLYFWNVNYSVYCSSFNSIHLSLYELGVYAYRYAVGVILSFTIIIIFSLLDKYKIVKTLAEYGQYTLTMYVFSLVFGVILSNRLSLHLEGSYLEIVSFGITIFIMVASVMITKVFRKNKLSKLFFLGES